MPAKLFIVEDDPDILNLVSVFLKTRGYAVHTAKNGREALERIREVKPDVLITDVMMPEVNGYQLVHRLMSDEYEIPLPKIIMLTSRTDPNDVHRGLNVGADMYITKPFDMGDLAERVAELLMEPKP